ncbi:MAG: ClpX C4-type zinc finger [Myxococcales bacterium]|nr:ClpX C4-type zinc finger [Myxococcales bacterium]
MVCNACHRSLGGVSVGATGEFRVPSAEYIAAQNYSESSDGQRAMAHDARHSGPTSVCAWCGKLEAEVKKLLGRGNVALCNECVSLCCDILDAELGADWR